MSDENIEQTAATEEFAARPDLPAEEPAVEVPAVAAAEAEPLEEPEPFDISAFPLRTLELWSDNAAAFVRLTEDLGKAKSVEEAIDLQGRFLTDRFDAMMRETRDLFERGWRFGAAVPGPLCAGFAWETRRSA